MRPSPSVSSTYPQEARRRVSPRLGSSSRTAIWDRSRGTSVRWCRRKSLLWQDPVPALDHALIGKQDIAALKAKILASGLSISQMASTAWGVGGDVRGSDKRGGANGARIRLAPQKDWEVQPAGSTGKGASESSKGSKRSSTLRSPVARSPMEKGKRGFARRPDCSGRLRGRRGGGEEGGHDVKVPFTPGRTDASQEQTDVHSFAPLERLLTGSATISKADSPCRLRNCCWIGRSC